MQRVLDDGVNFHFSLTLVAPFTGRLSDRMPRRPFDLLVGVMMLAICVFLLRRPSVEVAGGGGRWVMRRRVVEVDGTVHEYSYNPVLGASGLFQIIPGTWRANSVAAGYGGASVWDPVANANVAAYMFSIGQARQWSCK